MFSMKATKFEKIFTVDMTICSKISSIFVAFFESMNFNIKTKWKIFSNFCGLLRISELYSALSSAVTMFMSKTW